MTTHLLNLFIFPYVFLIDILSLFETLNYISILLLKTLDIYKTKRKWFPNFYLIQ